MRLLVLVMLVVSGAANGMSDSLKDPTRPTSYRSQSSDLAVNTYSMGLSIDAIFMRENSRVAIINGVPASVGEQHFGAKLIAINTDSVVVEQVIDGVIQQTTIGINSTGEVKKNATNKF